jgi:Trk K+ transport system NAD-binding subunit
LEGFDYCGQTVFESALGGKEVSVILEQNPAQPARRISYKVLATSRTSTLEKELNEAGAEGFQFLGVVVGSTAFGGKEVVSVLRKYE